MKFITWKGNLKLANCCAHPHNEVRFVEVEDVKQWAEERGYRLCKVPEGQAIPSNAAFCQSEHNNT